MNILLVEDDMALSMGMEYALKKEEFQVKVCKNLKESRMQFSDDIDIILLDIMLPDGNGYEFCKEVREKSNVPIIFMTALEEESNIVMGLDIGGDDYITKPVRIKELVSRINAVMRRRGLEKESDSSRLISGDIIVEPLKCKVYVNKVEVQLTTAEYKLLLLLMENKGNVLPRNTILEKLWDCDGSFVDGNTLNVYIKRLREKLEEDIKASRYIETIRGFGYRWKEEVRKNGAL
ncbi:response regulator transcription factor [Clostridium sp. YIM B02505]|uniref:Stage 0 sporulation protein A homolog n=1 Tax=Clostridium yunnanense TaxID=2800325 RepID=A0ABS1EJZ7_9CLOT|nr:response regulator transcription factor [Clostridium yunnanense]MBK1809693.1 response regulator transcription factor [Clostridium yunnanense]